MVWFVVLGLLGWVAFLAAQAGDLKARLHTLEQRLADLRARIENSRVESVEAVSTPAIRTRVSKAQAPSPTPPTTPRPASAPIAAAAMTPAPIIRPRPTPAGPPPREAIAAWLSENGLAWLGGGVLALGGMFLVAYAAQQGFFTPGLRVLAAAALGMILLGVSEWLKRQAERDAGGHRLAAAVAAGAGAATLYAAAWASYWLYSFIGLEAAGALLAVISFGLLGLSIRHGEPLAMLAIGGALLAPAVTGPQHWDAPALTAYLALVVATGYAVAGARRWGRAGMITLLGAVLWAIAGYLAEGYVRVAALAVGPLALAVAAVVWRRRRAPGEPSGSDIFAWMPQVALVAAALLLAGLWEASLKGADLAAAAIGEVLLMGLAAFAARQRLTPPLLQLAAYLSAAFAAAAFFNGAPTQGLEIVGALLAIGAAACGVWAAFGAQRELEQFAAAGGAVAALVLALATQGPLTASAPYAPAGLGAVLLGLCSALVVRRTATPARNVPLALWIWTGTAALLMTLKIASDPQVLPLVVAVPAAIFAVLHVRLGWRGLAGAAIACALASLAALLSPDMLRPAFASHQWPIALAAVAAVSAAVVAGASRLIRDQDQAAPAADSLATAAILIAVTGVMLLLRYWGAGHGGGWRLDPFAEAALRTVTIVTAGLLSTMAVRGDSHPIARWRGHVLLVAGLVHAVIAQALLLNPLWAWWTPAVSGPPLIDSVALGFLAPGLLFAMGATKRVTTERRLTAVYAAAAFAFGLLWAVLEIRRLYQSASLHLGVDAVGRAEAASYALLGLLVARGLFAVAARARGRGWGLATSAGLVRGLGQVAAWIALAYAVVAYGLLASPWWGPIHRPLDSQATAALLFGLYAAGAAATLWIVRQAEGEATPMLARAGRITAVIVVFALLNLVTRWGFRGLDMRPVLQKASLETWTFSAVWGLYGFGLLIFATARREPDLRWAGLAVLLLTTAKVFLFDMAQLEGVVRAGSFLAVGGLLLAAAVIARRLSAPRPG